MCVCVCVCIYVCILVKVEADGVKEEAGDRIAYVGDWNTGNMEGKVHTHLHTYIHIHTFLS